MCIRDRYSHEEDTHAYNLIDDVDQEEKQRRYDEIMSIQRDISLSINKNKIGSEIKVLIDRFENGFYYARTEFDSPEVDNEVIIRNAEFLRVGSFTKVKIVDANYYDLFAEIILNMFQNLSEKLERAFKTLKGRATISDINVAQTMKEIRKALISADVDYKTAKSFTDKVREKAIGQKVLTSIEPGQLPVSYTHLTQPTNREV